MCVVDCSNSNCPKSVLLLSNHVSVGPHFSSANYTTTELSGVFELRVNGPAVSSVSVLLKNGTAMCKKTYI